MSRDWGKGCQSLARHGWGPLLLIALCALALTACRDMKKESEAFSKPALERLLPLIDRDIKQVRTGLPKVAKEIIKRLDDDPGADLAGLQRAMADTRSRVYELAAAKTTFLAFVDGKGVVVRSENDPDLAVGKSLIKELPGMKPLLGQPKGLVETLGYMHGFRGVQKGGDLQWVVGAPVIDKDGKRKGQLVTGWSFRRYAGLLEGNARRHAQKQAEDEKNKHPLIYVFLLHKDKAFGGPITPDVNAAKIAALGIPAKVSGKAVFQTTLEIEKRDFAIAARAVPALGKDVAVAVLVAVL